MFASFMNRGAFLPMQSQMTPLSTQEPSSKSISSEDTTEKIKTEEILNTRKLSFKSSLWRRNYERCALNESEKNFLCSDDNSSGTSDGELEEEDNCVQKCSFSYSEDDNFGIRFRH